MPGFFFAPRVQQHFLSLRFFLVQLDLSFTAKNSKLRSRQLRLSDATLDLKSCFLQSSLSAYAGKKPQKNSPSLQRQPRRVFLDCSFQTVLARVKSTLSTISLHSRRQKRNTRLYVSCAIDCKLFGKTKFAYQDLDRL